MNDGIDIAVQGDNGAAHLQDILFDLARHMNGHENRQMVERAQEVSETFRGLFTDLMVAIQALADERNEAIEDRVRLEKALKEMDVDDQRVMDVMEACEKMSLEWVFEHIIWENTATLEQEFGWSATESRTFAAGLADVFGMTDEPHLYRPLLRRFADQLPEVEGDE